MITERMTETSIEIEPHNDSSRRYELVIVHTPTGVGIEARNVSGYVIGHVHLEVEIDPRDGRDRLIARIWDEHEPEGDPVVITLVNKLSEAQEKGE